MKHLSTLVEMAVANPGISNAKMAAAIVKRNRVLTYGINRYKTHPLQAKYSRNVHATHLHAEIDAFQRALREYTLEDLDGCTLFVVRVRKNGMLAMARPCSGCMPALRTFGMARMVYSVSGGYNDERL